ncbi:MAG: hypothetical protein AB1478_01765 [Nitrospirota bacterium]
MKNLKYLVLLVLAGVIMFGQTAIAGQGNIKGSISHADIEDNVYTTLKIAGDYQLSAVSTKVEYSGRLAKESYNRSFRGEIVYSPSIGTYGGIVKRLGEINTEISLPSALKWQIIDNNKLYWIKCGMNIKKMIKGANANIGVFACMDTKDGKNIQAGLMPAFKGQVVLNDLSENLTKKLQNIAKISYSIDGYYLYRFEAESKYNIRQWIEINRDLFYFKALRENDSKLTKTKRTIENGIKINF